MDYVIMKEEKEEDKENEKQQKEKLKKKEILHHDWLHTYRGFTTVLPEEDFKFIVLFDPTIIQELLLNAWIYFRYTNELVQQRYGPCTLPFPSEEVIKMELPVYEMMESIFETFISLDTEELKSSTLRLKFILSTNGREINLWKIPVSLRLPNESAFIWTYPIPCSNFGFQLAQKAKVKAKESSPHNLQNAIDYIWVLFERGYETYEEWSNTILTYQKNLFLLKDIKQMKHHELTTLYFFKECDGTHIEKESIRLFNQTLKLCKLACSKKESQ